MNQHNFAFWNKGSFNVALLWEGEGEGMRETIRE